MQIVDNKTKKKILEQLKKDILKTNDKKNWGKLNSIAIKKIYKSEPCMKCGFTVSMLNKDGLCGCCEQELTNI